MTDRRPINRTDLIAGLLVICLGMFALIGSWQMPRFENRGADPFTIPGLTPGLLGIIITGLGLMLLVRAMRGYHVTGGGKPTITQWSQSSALRTIFTVAAVIIYASLLFGRMHFVLATTIFIFAFSFGAEWINNERKHSIPVTAALSLVLSVCAAFAIHYVFTSIFLVRLPG